MSTTAMKKTPQKRDKEDQPRQATPVRTHLVTRAVSMQTRKASQASEKKAEKGSRKTEEGSIRRKATPHKAKTERQKKDEEDGGSVPTSESEAEATDGDKALEEEEEEEESRVATTTEPEESISDIATVDHKDNGLPAPTQPDEITVVKQQIERVTTERITVVEKEVESKPTKEEIDATQVNLKEQEVLSSYTSTTPVNLKEQELLRSYEQLWEAENRLREKINEQERRRRVKAGRRIDHEYEKRMAELYAQPSTSSTQASLPVITPLMPPEYESIKIEVESEDEGEISENKGKLKEELARMQASLLEKEHLIEKLQQTSSNNLMQHPLVIQALRQLEEKRIIEAKTFSDGRKDLEEHLHKLIQENKKLIADVEELRHQGEDRQKLVDCVSEALEAETDTLALREKELREREEKLLAEKRQLEKEALEKRDEIERREKNFKDELARAVEDKFKEMKAARRQRAAAAAARAASRPLNEQEPVPVGDEGSLQGDDDSNHTHEDSRENHVTTQFDDNVQEDYSQENYDTAQQDYAQGDDSHDNIAHAQGDYALTDDAQAQGDYAQGYAAQDDSESRFSSTDVSADLDNSTHTEPSSKRRRLADDDDDNRQQFAKGHSERIPGSYYEPLDNPNGNVAKRVYQSILQPYAGGIAAVVAAGFIGAVHYANEMAHYLPQATNLL